MSDGVSRDFGGPVEEKVSDLGGLEGWESLEGMKAWKAWKA